MDKFDIFKNNNNTATDIICIQNLLTNINEYFAYIGCSIEFLIFIFLILKWKSKPSNISSSSYFHLLTLGYFIDLFCFFIRHIQGIQLNLEFPLLFFIKKTSQWYGSLVIGPWNVALCLNRLTSILWYHKHQRIWSSKNFMLILGLLLVYPFLVNGYSFTNFRCKIAFYSDECAPFLKQIHFVISISNGICAIISLVVGITTTFLYHNLMKSNTNMTNVQLKVEKNLLIQSVFSSICFGVFCIAVATFPFYFSLRQNPNYFFAFILNEFAINILFNIFHFSSFILLLIYSKALRHEIIKFYSRIFQCRKSKAAIISFVKLRTKNFIGVNEISPK